jgi:hypothetical protein
MQAGYKLLSALFALALLAPPVAAQQSAKSGKYTGKFIYHAVAGAGQTCELEKGHVFFLGPAHGVFLNDIAKSFLDKTEVICPLLQDIVGGLVIAGHGYCIMTDKDGDKAFLVWEGKNTAPGTGGGPFKWTGGTGKYSGLQGNNTFHYTAIGKTQAFVGVWEGAGDCHNRRAVGRNSLPPRKRGQRVPPSSEA